MMPSEGAQGGGDLRVLDAAGYRRMPWKNGRGETTEVAVFPAGAGLDDFDWRVSMARVATAGPFSRFEGIDRTLCLLEGDGIDLAIAGRGAVRITTESGPFVFPGDVETEGMLVGGPILDLNVMSRRGRSRHAVRALRPEGTTALECIARTMLVLAHGGACRVECPGGTADLNALDCALLEKASGPLRLDGDTGARVFLIGIQAPDGA